MLTKVVRPVIRTVNTARIIGVRSYAYDYKDYKPPTMDELPDPQGSWQEQYDQYQRKYNKHLILGITSFGIALTALLKSDVYFNWGPPIPPDAK